MLPIYLSIEGVYSYQEKQEVDFTTLTEAGLFGIFGNVGSGKSTILEAISFALYGITERINKTNNRAYNMLNLKSNAACIVFEFYNFEGRKFQFVAQWKRKNKHFQETSTLLRQAYEWKKEGWVPLESNDGSLYTNLTYANFKRTIIIPQGQFREFLDLTGTDRSAMMKEIFQLERFDLGMKTSRLQRENNNRIENLKGALSGFETVSEEALTTKKEEFTAAQTQLKVLRSDFEILEIRFKKLHEAKKNRLELEVKEKEYSILKLDEPKIRKQEEDLNRFETTQIVFKDLIATSNKLNKDKEILTHKIENLTAQKDRLTSAIEKEEQLFTSITDEYNQLETYRSQTQDIKLLIENKNHQHRWKETQHGIEKGTPYVLQAKEEEEKLRKILESEEKDLDELKDAKIDTSGLLAIENWYQEKDRLIKEKDQLSVKKQTLESEIAYLHQQFEVQGTQIGNWEQQLQEHSIQLKEREHAYQQKETQLQVHRKLSEFAQHLHEGDPCPLCGSLSHPQLMEGDNLASLEHNLSVEKEEISAAQQKLQQRYQLLTQLSTSTQEKNKQLESIHLETNGNSQAIEQHEQSFCWEEFSAVDKTKFSVHKNKSQTIEDEIKKAEHQLKLTREKLHQAQQKVINYENRLQTYKQNAEVLARLIQQNEGQLRVIQSKEVENHSAEELSHQGIQLGHKIDFVTNEFKRITESLTLSRHELASISGQRREAKMQFQQLIIQLKDHQAEVAALLLKHEYNDLMEVQRELNKNISIPTVRQEIQTFKIAFHSLESQIAELIQKNEEDNFDEEEYQAKAALVPLMREELDLKIKDTGALEKELTRLQSEFAKKEQLLQTLQKLTQRKENLTTIENLFRGAGFVNYVSSIHLQHLCEIANQRFHRLTHNQLSLSINKNNDFEVIDYLNNGYSRSIKTLSGGQSFQASLCLALALAENIQSLNKADKNFFFIDEGFGTQDAESIHAVFETLNYLHKENRIVGIISHVEELKERIPRTITVVNDQDLGSKILIN